MIPSQFPTSDGAAAGIAFVIITALQVVSACAIAFAAWCGRQS